MRVLFIYKSIDAKKQIDENSYLNGCGGLENWLVELSMSLSRNGIDTTVMCNCANVHLSYDNVHYIPIENYDYVMQNFKYDAIIINSDISDILEKCNEYGTSKNIYVQGHNINIRKNNLNVKYDGSDLFRNLKKVVALTEFHKATLMKFNTLPDDKIQLIGNGIRPELFTKYSMEHEIDHNILWSSVFINRNPEILLDEILPLVRKEIPDVGVYFTTYFDHVPDFQKYENVHFLGMLKKNELYNEMSKHAVWFTPSTFPENYCITMIENAMCGVDLCMPFNCGPVDVMKPFVNEIGMKHQFKHGEEEHKLAVEEAAAKIVDSIRNYHSPEHVERRERIKEFIMNNHTWDCTAKKWIAMMKENNE